MTSVVYHEGAYTDLQTAIGYFETEARPGTAEKFLAQLDHAISTIEQSPGSCPIPDQRHYRQRIFKFPYELIYRMDGEGIVIVAVSHSSRSPSYWQDRR